MVNLEFISTYRESPLLNFFPAGTVIMWAGRIEDIPKGWALCDGKNGRPNIQGKFIIGASEKYPLGTFGGSEEVTLTIDQIPSHKHAIASPSGGAVGGQSYPGGSGVPDYTEYKTFYDVRIDSTEPTGGSQPHSNMPPYYSLHVIIKLEEDASWNSNREQWKKIIDEYAASLAENKADI